MVGVLFCDWVKLEVADYAKFGEMLLIGLAEANRFLEDIQSEFRFKESIDLGEEVYDIYSAKKKNGKPKDGDPSK